EVFAQFGTERVDVVVEAVTETSFTASFSGALFPTDDVYPLSIVAEDDVGNRLEGPLGPTVTLDTQAPTILENSVRIDFFPNSTSAEFPVNPLDRTDQVTVGTEVVVEFVLDEMPSSAELVSDSGVEFELTGGLSLNLRFELDRSLSSFSTGDAALTAEITDTAGNSASIPIGSLVVDVTPPPAPNTAPGMIVYERRPNGNLDDPTPSSQIVGAATAVEANARVIAQSELGAFLGETLATDTGSFELSLPVTNVSSVSLLVVDAAGNTSGLEAEDQRIIGTNVRDGCFTATPRATGLVRPHQLAGFAVATPHVGSGVQASIPNGAIESVDDATASISTGIHWRLLRDPITRPRARIFAAAAYVPTLGEVVFRGGTGFGSSGLSGDTIQTAVDDGRIYGFGRWSELTPIDPEGDGDPGFELENIVFDRGLGGLLSEPDATGQSWLFIAGSWRRIGPPVEATFDPSLRRRGDRRLAHAREESRTFMVVAGSPAELWTFDDGEWQVLCDSSVVCEGLPSVQNEFSLAYDDTQAELVVVSDGKTWTVEVDEAPVWTLRCDATDCQSPSTRFGSAMAFESARRRVVLFGGCQAMAAVPDEQCGELFVDTWTWDGAAWSCLIESATPANNPTCAPDDPTCSRPLCNQVFDNPRNPVIPADAPVGVPLNGYSAHLLESDEGLLLVGGQGYAFATGGFNDLLREGEHLLTGAVWTSLATDVPFFRFSDDDPTVVTDETSGDVLAVSEDGFAAWNGLEWQRREEGSFSPRDSAAL
ncbi:MAG: hypothetical protein AAF658_09420, partial [Myxococcota bacterium]